MNRMDILSLLFQVKSGKLRHQPLTIVFTADLGLLPRLVYTIGIFQMSEPLPIPDSNPICQSFQLMAHLQHL